LVDLGSFTLVGAVSLVTLVLVVLVLFTDFEVVLGIVPVLLVTSTVAEAEATGAVSSLEGGASAEASTSLREAVFAASFLLAWLLLSLVFLGLAFGAFFDSPETVFSTVFSTKD
jgi:hypothetical protein